VVEKKWHIEVNPEHASLEKLGLLEALMVTVCGSQKETSGLHPHWHSIRAQEDRTEP